MHLRFLPSPRVYNEAGGFKAAFLEKFSREPRSVRRKMQSDTVLRCGCRVINNITKTREPHSCLFSPSPLARTRPDGLMNSGACLGTGKLTGWLRAAWRADVRTVMYLFHRPSRRGGNHNTTRQLMVATYFGGAQKEKIRAPDDANRDDGSKSASSLPPRPIVPLLSAADATIDTLLSRPAAKAARARASAVRSAGAMAALLAAR
jgi:hypothetical protein